MIRFYNGRVVTMEGAPRAEALEVRTDGGKIVYVGPEMDDGQTFEREIDMRGGVLLPGFKDAHTHSAMTFLRSFAIPGCTRRSSPTKRSSRGRRSTPSRRSPCSNI